MPFLDGIRAFAALLVLMGHFSYGGMLAFGDFSFEGIEKPGVYLFFFLSAFLLSRIVVTSGDRFWSREGIGFYGWRRFMRIYPLLTLYLLLAVLTTGAASGLLGREVGVPLALGVGDFVRHMLLIDGQGVLWSIVVEFKFYAVLPFAALAFGVALSRGGVAAWLALAVALIVLCRIIWPGHEAGRNEMQLGYHMPVFLLGTALGVLDARRHRQIAASAAARGLACVLLALAAVALVLSTPAVASLVVGQELPATVFFGWHLCFGLMFAAALFGLRYGPAIARAPFETGVMRYIGMISFSIYLWHPVAMRIFGFSGIDLSPSVAWIVVLAMTIVVSHLSYHVIEKRFLAMTPADAAGRARAAWSLARRPAASARPARRSATVLSHN